MTYQQTITLSVTYIQLVIILSPSPVFIAKIISLKFSVFILGPTSNVKIYNI